jgi:hypothetical protein
MLGTATRPAPRTFRWIVSLADRAFLLSLIEFFVG